MYSTCNLYRTASRAFGRRPRLAPLIGRPFVQHAQSCKLIGLASAATASPPRRFLSSSPSLSSSKVPSHNVDPNPAPNGADKSKEKKKAPKPVTILDVQKKYKKGKKLTMVTAYDYPSGMFADKAGVDMILVGDSVGMVVMGHSSTVPVTVRDMVHHCQAVRRGIERCYLIGDMPFGSYLTVKDAVKNAGRIMKEGRVDAVKFEGGRRMINQIRATVDCGISVVGHIGLTPQTASSLGGFRVQGRNASVAVELLKDALALQEAGVQMIVLECVPSRVAQYVTDCLSIPTIGIGAGNGCSGQVQVFHDMVGMFDKFSPKFSKRYVDIGTQIQNALKQYCDDVQTQEFPSESHSFKIKDDQYEKFLTLAEGALGVSANPISKHKSQIKSGEAADKNNTNGTNSTNTAPSVSSMPKKRSVSNPTGHGNRHVNNVNGFPPNSFGSYDHQFDGGGASGDCQSQDNNTISLYGN